MTVDDSAAGKAQRFSFGENWAHFQRTIDEAIIAQACASLSAMLGLSDLRGKTFLDIGSGSGLFSLAAHRMGAEVTSFDYDPDSVGCTQTLRDRFAAGTDTWRVTRGSVLDETFMASLGTFDIVYSWGVLHHTGALWRAVDLAARAVSRDGCFFIALYNDQGVSSRRWLRIKQTYNRLPRALRNLYVAVLVFPREVKWILVYLMKGNPQGYIRTWTDYGRNTGRGMNKWRDWVDWIGGLPFEVAKPEQVLDALRPQGFELVRMTTVMHGWGCNEYVLHRRHGP